MIAPLNARARVLSSWGESCPDWVLALADAADRESQAAAARAIGYSPAVVSQVLKGVYAGGFSTRPTRYPADRFTAEQIALLEADPGLIVSTIDEPEPATKSGKGAAE